MKFRQFKFVGLLIIMGASSLSADMFTPSHSCSKPIKPYQFDSQWELDSLNDEVQRYKRCISDFADEQHEDARRHQEAAQEAIEEWNRYVNYELN